MDELSGPVTVPGDAFNTKLPPKARASNKKALPHAPHKNGSLPVAAPVEVPTNHDRMSSTSSTSSTKAARKETPVVTKPTAKVLTNDAQYAHHPHHHHLSNHIIYHIINTGARENTRKFYSKAPHKKEPHATSTAVPTTGAPPSGVAPVEVPTNHPHAIHIIHQD